MLNNPHLGQAAAELNKQATEYEMNVDCNLDLQFVKR